MNTKSLGALIGLTACLVLSKSTEASAWGYWPVCGDYEEAVSTVIDQKIGSITEPCYLVPLKLERTPDGDLTVDSWIGGYDLQVSMTTTYRIDHYDHCSGAFLWSEQQVGTEPQTLNFNVINPNLESDLPSYVSNAPMTDEEAQAALPEALGRCKKVHTGEWPQP
jgi:hypothetical protein